MKKLLYAVVLLMGLSGSARAESISLISRSGNVIGSFSQPVKFVLGKSVAVGYARTFQKSSTDNRLIGLLPVAEWGILNVNLVGATADFNDITGQRELLGIGGGVQANKVLALAFPETESLFVGDVPWTNGKLQYEMEFGALAGFDFTRSEPVTGFYVTPEIKF